MSTLKVTHLQNESNSAPSISISNAVGGGVTFAGISTFHGSIRLGTDIEGHPSADDLTIATSGDTGMTIRSGTSNQGSLYFSDATSGGGEYAGWLRYSHLDSNMTIGVAENERLLISSDGLVDISGGIQVSENVTPTSGEGVEIFAPNSGTGQIQSFDRTNNNFDKLIIKGDPVEIYDGSAKKFETTSAGLTIYEDTDKTISFTGGIGEIGNVTGFQALNTAGSSLVEFGIRATDIRFATGNAERLRITSAGKLLLPTGTPGIQFGSPDSDGGNIVSQTLDDYEEGKWTPTINASVSSYLWQTGRYTKVGNLVTVWFDVKWSTASSIPSDGQIEGLPFSAVASTDQGGYGAPQFRDLTGITGTDMQLNGNSSYFSNPTNIILKSFNSSGVEQSATFGTNGRITGSGFYYVNDAY